MGRESCPHVPCVTSGGRAPFARPWCGWRRGGARRGGHAPRARPRCARGPRPPRHLGPPPTHRRTARGWPRGTTPVCRSRRRAWRRRAPRCAAPTPIVATRGRTRCTARRAGPRQRHWASVPRTGASRARAPPGGRRSGGRAGDEEADALAVPAFEQRGERRLVDGVGVDQQDGPTVDPGTEPPRAPPVPSKAGSWDSSTLPSRCAASAAARWWVLTATADGVARPTAAKPSSARSTRGVRPTGHSALGRSNGQRDQPRAAARGQHHACQTLPHGDRHAPILQPLAAPDVADLRLAALLQRVLGAAAAR